MGDQHLAETPGNLTKIQPFQLIEQEIGIGKEKKKASALTYSTRSDVKWITDIHEGDKTKVRLTEYDTCFVIQSLANISHLYHQ